VTTLEVGNGQATAATVVMLAGQVIAGGATSLTVTVNEQLLWLLTASLTMQFTAVTPLGKAVPLGGVQLTAPTPEQLSLAAGSG
jgi:hypothetical protein